MVALSHRGRRMVWVALLNLCYLAILALLSKRYTSSGRNILLEKSTCNRSPVSISPPNTSHDTTCNHSSADKTQRDLPSSLSSGIADKAQDSRNKEELTIASVSSSSILMTALSQPTTTSDTLPTEGRGRRQEREISLPSTDTSMPQTDTSTYQDIKSSTESTPVPLTFESSSSMHDISPSPAHPSTPLSTISSAPPASSLLPASSTTDASVAQTKTETTEIKTRGGKVTEPSHKNFSEPRNSHNHSTSTPSEATTPGVTDTPEDHANAQPPSGHLHLGITVNATGVTLAVDGVQVYSDLNRTMAWGKGRARLHAGLHLVSLHPFSGQVTAANSFMTWQVESDTQFLNALRDTQDSRLLLVAGAPEFTSYLGEEVTTTLEDLGSLFADRFAYSDAWCLLLHKGQRVLHEAIVTSRPGHNYTIHDVPPLVTHVTVPRMPERRCGWHATPGMEERASFCSTYDGYGAFCSCHEPPWSPHPASPVSYAAREVIPVAIATARRLPRVLRQVAQLWASPGGLHTPVSIFVDGHSPEAQRLAALLEVPVTEHHGHTQPGSAARINEHIKHVVTQAFRQHPEVDKVIVLEDDLELAPDFIPFFQQTASLLTEDPNLFCVNAYNYNAYDHTALDPTRLYRVHGLPAYGWMVRRHVAEEMVRQWAPLIVSVDWDLWLRQTVMGSRDILVPELPRTKHVGGGGAHVTGLEQALYHGRRPLNTRPLVALDLQGAQRQRYLLTHHTAIAEAQVVRFTDHPCKVLPLPRHQVNQSFVVYIDVPENTTSDSYYVVARCLGLNDRNAHENLHVMYTSSFFGNQLYIVGCPVSSFCLTEDEGDVYKASPEDRKYALKHPFRPPNIDMHIAIRSPPISFSDLVNLSNLLHYNYFYS